MVKPWNLATVISGEISDGLHSASYVVAPLRIALVALERRQCDKYHQEDESSNSKD
jgi:hypothetical protein